MKKQLLILALMISGQSLAQECSEQFEAKYHVLQNNKELALNVWRNGSAVAYQNSNSSITDHWTSSPKQRLKLVRLFDAHKRGIEYEAKQYGNKITWENLFHKFEPQRLAQMKLVNTAGQGCDKVETYTQNHQGQEVEVQWLPEYQLAKVIAVKGKNQSMVWSLTELNIDSKEVSEQFAMWDNYHLTDYVDIGDNESDPFLAKMINMGFVQGGASGFYDSKGNQLSGHGHHH